jgi:hypothetical protein
LADCFVVAHAIIEVNTQIGVQDVNASVCVADGEVNFQLLARSDQNIFVAASGVTGRRLMGRNGHIHTWTVEALNWWCHGQAPEQNDGQEKWA